MEYRTRQYHYGEVFTRTLCRIAIRNLLQPDGVTFKMSIELLINMQWPQDKDLFIPDGIKLYDNTICVLAYATGQSKSLVFIKGFAVRQKAISSSPPPPPQLLI